MLCHKQDYLEVEKIHCKALKIVYNSNECYEELLIHNNEVSIHQKQLRSLVTEIYKSLTDVNPNFMKNYFSIKKYLQFNSSLGYFTVRNVQKRSPEVFYKKKVFLKIPQN